MKLNGVMSKTGVIENDLYLMAVMIMMKYRKVTTAKTKAAAKYQRRQRQIAS